MGGKPGFDGFPFRIPRQLLDDRNGHHHEVPLGPVPLHNPSVRVNLLDRHSRFGRQLRRHDQPTAIIKQGCIHNGSFPRFNYDVKVGMVSPMPVSPPVSSFSFAMRDEQTGNVGQNTQGQMFRNFLYYLHGF